MVGEATISDPGNLFSPHDLDSVLQQLNNKIINSTPTIQSNTIPTTVHEFDFEAEPQVFIKPETYLINKKAEDAIYENNEVFITGTGGHLYTEGYFARYNVSATPTLTATVEFGTDAYGFDIAKSATYAYCSGVNKIYIVDLSNNTLAATHVVTETTRSFQDIIVDGTALYTIDNSSLMSKYDISVATDLIEIASNTSDYWGNYFEMFGDYIYAAYSVGAPTTIEGEMAIYSKDLVSTTKSINTQYAILNLVQSGDYIFGLDAVTLYSFDISDPTNPIQLDTVGNLPSWTRAPVVYKDYVIANNRDNNFVTTSIADATNMIHVDTSEIIMDILKGRRGPGHLLNQDDEYLIFVDDLGLVYKGDFIINARALDGHFSDFYLSKESTQGTFGHTNVNLIGDLIGNGSKVTDLTTNQLVESATNLFHTDERSQDAIGQALIDTNTVNATYDDPNNQISFEVNEASLTIDTSQITGSFTQTYHNSQSIEFVTGASTHAKIRSHVAGTNLLFDNEQINLDNIDVILDNTFSSNGLLRRTGTQSYDTITDNSSNWNSAYTIINTSATVWDSAVNTLLDNQSNWNLAYSWGDHSAQGYAQVLADLTPGTADSYIDMDNNSLIGLNILRSDTSILSFQDSSPTTLLALSNSGSTLTTDLNLSNNQLLNWDGSNWAGTGIGWSNGFTNVFGTSIESSEIANNTIQDIDIDFTSFTLSDLTPGTADGDINMGDNDLTNLRILKSHDGTLQFQDSGSTPTLTLTNASLDLHNAQLLNWDGSNWAGTGIGWSSGNGFTATLGTTIDTTEIVNGTIQEVDLDLTDITLNSFVNDAGYITAANDIWVDETGDTMTPGAEIQNVGGKLTGPWHSTHLNQVILEPYTVATEAEILSELETYGFGVWNQSGTPLITLETSNGVPMYQRMVTYAQRDSNHDYNVVYKMGGQLYVGRTHKP